MTHMHDYISDDSIFLYTQQVFPLHKVGHTLVRVLSAFGWMKYAALEVR